MGAGPAARSLSSTITQARLGTEPLTVNLEPLPALAPALRTKDDNPTVLAIEGIEGNVTQPIRINIFLNEPGAGRHNATDDPRCVGFIQVLPVRGKLRPTSEAFDLSQIPDFDPKKPIQVTLVPVVGTDGAPRDVSLSVGRIYLRRDH
jgi:hypothetical protein